MHEGIGRPADKRASHALPRFNLGAAKGSGMSDISYLRTPTEAEFSEAARQSQQARFARQRSVGGRVAALDRLHAQLADDAQLYESDNLQDQRDAVAHALLGVVSFLQLQGFSNATLGPLMRPVLALMERENNSLDFMFAQRARGGRPKATLTDHERTGILAALAEGWLRVHKGDDRSQADKLAEAARKMKGRWFGEISRAQLETARDLVAQEASDHPAVSQARLYSGFFDNAATTYGADNAFGIMVRWLNNTKASFGLGQGGISKTPPVSPSEES